MKEPRRLFLKVCLANLAVAIVCFAVSRMGVELATWKNHIAPVWPVRGIAVAALLLWGFELLPGIVAAALAGPLIGHAAPWQSLGFASAGVLGAVFAVLLLTRVVPIRKSLDRMRDAGAFLVLGVLVSPILAALLGTLTHLAGRGVTPRESPMVALQWWVGDALGILLVAPPILTWAASRSVRWTFRRMAEAGLLVVSLLAVSEIVFGERFETGRFAMAFLIVPLLFWGALRLGPRESSTLVLLVATLSLWATGRHIGPFATKSVEEGIVTLDAYLALLAVTTLLAAAVVSERGAGEEALRESEERYRWLVERSPDAIGLHQDGAFRYLNPAALQLFGFEDPAEIVGQPVLGIVHPDDRPVVSERIRKRYEGHGNPAMVEIRVRRKNGSWVDVETTGIPARIGGRIAAQVILRDITERKAAAEALRQSERRFRALIENALDVITVLDADGTISYGSPSVARVTGFLPSELVGRNAFAFIHADDLPNVEAAFHTVSTAQGATARVVYRFRHKDSSWRVLESVGTNRLDDPNVLGIIVNSRDITDRKRAEEALEESRRFVQQVADSAPTIIYVQDVAENETVYVNAAVAPVLGYAPAEIQAMPGAFAEAILHPDDRTDLSRHVRALANAHDRKVLETEVRMRHANGGWRRLVRRETILSRTEIGQPERVLGILEDVTERRRDEEERRRLQERVSTAQRLESLGLLAGGAAEDFSNLLVEILGNASLLARDLPPDSPLRASLGEIENAANRAADLARQMLAYSGRGRLVLSPVRLPELVRDMAELLRSAISRKADLRLVLDDDAPAIEADTAQLRQVILNLVTNASEALEEEPGLVTLRVGRAEAGGGVPVAPTFDDLEPRSPGPSAFLDVTDTGAGMDAGLLGRIFDPFFTTKSAGRGLGLAAVLGIVRGHRGTIHVKSEPGSGSTFRVFLPAASAATPAGESVLPSSPSQWRGHGAVLVVDDEESVRTMLTRFLMTLGFEVLVAPDPHGGLELLRAPAAPPCAVLLDVPIRDANPRDALAALRREWPEVPVILMSGYSAADIAEKFPPGAAPGFLHKPFGLAELAAVLGRVLPPFPPVAKPAGRSA